MSQVPRRFRFYTTLVVVATIALFVQGVYSASIESQSRLVLPVFILAVLVSENLAVSLPNGGSTSIAYPFFLAAMLVMGPVPGALVAAAAGISIADIRSRRSPWILAFNLCQLMLVVLITAIVYSTLGGSWLLSMPLTSTSLLPSIVPLLSAVVVSALLNDLLVTIGMTLITRQRFAVAWDSGAAWLLPMQVALGVFALALAFVTAIAPASFLLIVFPLMLARQVYQQYLELRAAYPASTRSLITALEVKDTYTRGHAERVAEYTRILGQQMGLSRSALGRLELAALLHDIGKIAIERDILRKPTRLTAAERRRIEEHPSIGADILEGVEYLADIVPMVRLHHERMDGSGYGLGVAACEIPLECRILAVADAYDAMTSERAYRRACSHSDAMDEIALCAGTQFDPEVAAALVAAADAVSAARETAITGAIEDDGIAQAT